jgi:hypothetical protein|tara:strand:- start:241 stop:639 length:399 start_codon:yes stop_codon:yes gene_type:complete
MPEIIINVVKFLIPFLVGGLIFFASVIAPTIFLSLDQKNARSFLRKIFPKIYLYSGVVSLVISVNLFFIDSFLSFIFIIITLGYLYSRQFLMLRINIAADNKNDKDFKKLHRFSVIIFLSQIILMILVYTLI